jgi:hypothetical protein
VAVSDPLEFDYVATPYSKFSGGLYAAYLGASKIAAGLIKRGFIVYCPIAHCHPIAMAGGLDPLDHKIWLPLNEPFLKAASRLFVAHMDGWQDSYGISEEVKTFEAAVKPIFDLDPVSLAMVRRT